MFQRFIFIPPYWNVIKRCDKAVCISLTVYFHFSLGSRCLFLIGWEIFSVPGNKCISTKNGWQPCHSWTQHSYCLCERKTHIWVSYLPFPGLWVHNILQMIILMILKENFHWLNFCIAKLSLQVLNPRYRLAVCLQRFPSFKARPCIKLSSHHREKWLFSPHFYF